MKSRKPPKDQREKLVLLGLVDHFIETGKPVGSMALQESGFEELSSATIRNYFSKLEKEGYLKQQHSSGGRIPTSLAYQLYAETHLKSPLITEKEKNDLQKLLSQEEREVAAYFHKAAELLSEKTKCAVFLSMPRFDQDFVLDVKLVAIDSSRTLCILVTDFGLVQTELLYADKKLSTFALKRIERYFHWRLTGLDKPKLTAEEESLATRFYTEVMLRHLISHTNFSTEDIYKTGFSKLLAYPDFNDASALAGGLSLFENKVALSALLSECIKTDSLCCSIGDEMQGCSVIAIPYKINRTTVGAIALLGPSRVPYRKLFGTLETAVHAISTNLSKSLYKFKITFRTPESALIDMQPAGQPLLENKNE